MPTPSCQLEILTIGGQDVSAGEPTLQAANAPWTVHVRMRHPAGNPISYLSWLIGENQYTSEPPAGAMDPLNTNWVEHDLDPAISAQDVGSTNHRTNIRVEAIPEDQEAAESGLDSEFFSVEGFE